MIHFDFTVTDVGVKNIWEFYKLIGYDYKTKKWLLDSGVEA